VVTSITSLGDRALAYDIRKNKVPPGPARNNPL
jgi:ribosomal protein S6